MLLVGPPGTGKTLIARAVAGEAGVPFISITGSDFMEMFVGVGAARVRDLFQTARKQAPAIIFVDEIDSIGRKRGAGLGGGHDEREQTLNQMLSEMDGFEATEGIVMLAATNRPDILDSALLRPGRFDRQIMVPLPTQEERVEILKVHFKDKKISPDVGVEVIARGTPGMSGADLSNLVNEAALFAVRRGAQEVHKEDFDAARDRVLMGLRRESLALSEEEKEIVAYHEGGHAVCAYVLEFADPLHKVTILPTGMALGVTQQLPLEERHIYKREYIIDSLVVRLGGVRRGDHLRSPPIASRVAGMSVPSTGVPTAQASRKTMPNASWLEGRTRRSEAARRFVLAASDSTGTSTTRTADAGGRSEPYQVVVGPAMARTGAGRWEIRGSAWKRTSIPLVSAFRPRKQRSGTPGASPSTPRTDSRARASGGAAGSRAMVATARRC